MEVHVESPIGGRFIYPGFWWNVGIHLSELGLTFVMNSLHDLNQHNGWRTVAVVLKF